MRTGHRSDSWVLGWLSVLGGAALLRLLGVGGSLTQLQPADFLLGPAVIVYTITLEIERQRRQREQAEFDEQVAAWRARRRHPDTSPAEVAA
jgi:hypothetical protein